MATHSLDRTVAIMVSFNDPVRLEISLSALHNQVQLVVVVDNGSMPNHVSNLRRIISRYNAVLIELGENFGIGVALNRGIDFARDQAAEWVLTMDQDSTIDKNFMFSMSRALHKFESPVSLCPSLRAVPLMDGMETQEVSYAITSGHLVPLAIFDCIGEYDEGLFIDGVDFDFSLRLRDAGFLIIRVLEATMLHELGEQRTKIPFHTVHSPQRRYYMKRNFLILAFRHIFRHPRFIFRLFLTSVLADTMALIFGPNRLVTARAMVLGFIDGLLRRQGVGRII